MGKLMVILTVLVAIHLCLVEPLPRRGRDRKRGKGNSRRRGYDSDDSSEIRDWSPRGFSDGSSDEDNGFPFGRDGFPGRHRGHRGPFHRPGGFHGVHHGTSERRNWFSDLFGPRRFSFGVGPESDPWFNAEFSWELGGESADEPWWNGPNVCFSRNEETENNTNKISSHTFFHSQVCDGSDSAYKCTTAKMTRDGKLTVTDIYECCSGFTRKPGDYGCEIEVVLQDIPSLLESLELGELIKLLDSSGLNQEVFTQKNASFTIFAPNNEALANFVGVLNELSPGVVDDMGSVIMVSEQISDEVVDNTRNILLGHVAVGRYTSPQLSDNQLIETASPFKTKIRINSYQAPINLVTANCRPVMSMDNIATNGVIHVIGDVLKPVSETLFDLVRKNPELSTLKTALGRSTLAASLREDGQYTVFAPTDNAFKKHQQLMSKLMANQKCLDNVLKNHLLPNVICSAIVQGETKTQNMLDKYTNLKRDADDKLYADDSQIVRADIMATNGVLYIIDDVLLPDEALGLLELVEKQGLSEFTELIAKAGLRKVFDNAENVTVFVPSNEAIQALSPEVINALETDPDELQRVLKYHVVPEIHTGSKFFNNMQMETIVDGAKIRVNEYSSFPFGNSWIQTVQCAKIDKTSIKGCNGVVYVVDKMLLPPVGTVLDVLAQDNRFTTLVQLVKLAGLGDILQEQGPYTVFAPTNKAFNDLGSDAVTELRDNPKMLKSIILNHVTKDAICCNGLVRTNWFNTQKVRTLGQEMFKIGRNRNDGTYIGNADIVECDVAATNGVVHAIDTVLMKNRHTDDFDWFWDFN